MSHVVALTRCAARIPWARIPSAGALATTALSEWLYGEYFIGWRPSAPRLEYSGSPWYVAELTARCAGPTTFERGFRVTQRTRGGAFVESGGISLWVPHVAALRPVNARAGAEVAVELPCAREGAIPGFFTIVSRAGRLDPGAPHLKFYVNATPTGALDLVGALLELRTARFEAKVTNDPAHFGRRDTLLVYAAPGSAARIARLLTAFARRPRALRDETPPMTVPLARGVSVAESPGHHAESFGSHRCRLVAEGLLTARGEGRPSLTAVAERFEREGLDWAAPWFGALPRRWLDRLTSMPTPAPRKGHPHV
ncbi:MAG: T3SS effector HopA1 family protein [Archangium sp.]|nr:T3SS effector HopA1 family protein [Archangium sp.]